MPRPDGFGGNSTGLGVHLIEAIHMARYSGWQNARAVKRWLGHRGEATARPKAPQKYRNIPTTVNGRRHGSKREAERAVELQWQEQAGMITDLVLDKRLLRYDLIVNGVKVGSYEADARYRENGILVVEDVKSKPTRTREYRRNKKWMRALYGIEIREIE